MKSPLKGNFKTENKKEGSAASFFTVFAQIFADKKITNFSPSS